MRWSDAFTLRSRVRRGSSRSKTIQGEQMIWDGFFASQPLCVVSTVRLTGGNHAHFCVSSNARIGTFAWNLRGGHYVDLRVLSRHPLTRGELQALGQLARTEENRAVIVRQGKELLRDALFIPMDGQNGMVDHTPQGSHVT